MTPVVFNMAKARAAIEADGHPWSSAVEEFLANSGGLIISSYKQHDDGRVFHYTLCHFDPIRATKALDPGCYHEYGKRVGKPLTPIGEAGQGYLCLAMSSDGCVYGGVDETLVKLANSGKEAILYYTYRNEPRPIETIE